MQNSKSKQLKRATRHRRIRAKVFGTKEKPRLSVFRSGRFIYAQLIDDAKGHTLVSINDRGEKKGTKTARAELVGERIAKKAPEKKISKVVFDRGGFKYTGRIRALAEAARKAGLKF